MVLSYFSLNFMSLMILLGLVAMMHMNRDVKIPATKLFVVCIILMIALTIVGMIDYTSFISGLTPSEVAAIVPIRRVLDSIGYMIRPCVILTEVIIILHNKKYRILCSVPAAINAAVYSTALFGSGIAFSISADNEWVPGPLRLMIYITMLIYLLMLLGISLRSFRVGDKRKSLILVVILAQAVLVAVREYENGSDISFSNEIMALGILEYYIYLTSVYRQQLNQKLDEYVDEVEAAGNKLKELTAEIIEALASAIDAKDEYTRGHASRVAEYSRKLAEMNGKSKQECDEIYYAALLHDVGKIGIADDIISKDGKLTKEEYEEIKKHTVLGTQILERISEFPYLAVGATGHHERYDGKGYPAGLKGTDIPETARIIAVADAYDAMTSCRSYRGAIPQQIVREELVKGMGSQFDPDYARIMMNLIDIDTQYKMSEREAVIDFSEDDELVIEEYKSKISAGLLINAAMTTVNFRVSRNGKTSDSSKVPSLILFDALDGRVHTNEKEIETFNYFEYGEIWLDGKTTTAGARKIQTTITMEDLTPALDKNEYRIEAVRINDHALLRIISSRQIVTNIIALPDSARFLYIGFTGEFCRISHVDVRKAEEESHADDIPRIAEEISFIGGPEGDLPNLQINGFRTGASKGIELADGLQISFHTRSLPTACLIWHCPIIDIYCADDGIVNGDNYREIAFLRFDGEAWECDPYSAIKLNVNRQDEFEGWEEWKQFNQKGYDATITFKVDDDQIIFITENFGISIRTKIKYANIDRPMYVAITGDQVAITNIRIRR